MNRNVCSSFIAKFKRVIRVKYKTKSLLNRTSLSVQQLRSLYTLKTTLKSQRAQANTKALYKGLYILLICGLTLKQID